VGRSDGWIDYRGTEGRGKKKKQKKNLLMGITWIRGLHGLKAYAILRRANKCMVEVLEPPKG
jgi:IS5 family transposase